MEGEREEQGECTQSGTTSTQVDTLTQNCNEEPQNLQEPEEVEQADSGACDGEVEASQAGEELWIGDIETLITTNIQDDADCLPSCPQPTEEELTSPSVSPHPSNIHNRPSEPCWYCLRSLDPEYHPQTPEQVVTFLTKTDYVTEMLQEDSDPLSPLPSTGQKVSYQTDPRPHFGVAWSSHSTCRPLWGSEGPCWGQRNLEAPDQTHTCPHCHLGLPADTLRWHEAKCLLFEGLKNSKK
eukprot:superscaffoldBa00002934_g15683